MSLADEHILEKTVDLLKKGTFKKPNQITNVLYCLAKLNFKSKDGNRYIDSAME